ncbi:hypothetical protein BDY19DRAFT_358422 [Irpex rosettiformis]|uniref:Uncharacterized protein n=1 Tax=Irpex rosettiformis TaxID=378272 RepID=A0ACB8TWG9_9APHY|nr:hypothetical protein BDY19DRAFT_358422 [Irpex rosettiformis]
MYAKSSIAFLTVTLLAPTSVTAQLVQSIVLPGFAQGIANVSQGGVGTDGRTTFVALIVVLPTSSGSASESVATSSVSASESVVTSSVSVAAFAGTATMLVGPNGQTENKSQLDDGTNVVENCSYGLNQASYTAVVSNYTTTLLRPLSLPYRQFKALRHQVRSRYRLERLRTPGFCCRPGLLQGYFYEYIRG